MYSEKSTQERYFIFNTFVIGVMGLIIALITVCGTLGTMQTGDNTNKTSVACVEAGGSWLFNSDDDNSKWECKNDYHVEESSGS